MRLAVLCFIPELGHIAPLLRIAREAERRGAEVRCFLPDEARDLGERYEAPTEFIGAVRPEGTRDLRERMVARAGSPLLPMEMRRFEERYWVPLLLSLAARADRLRARVRAFEPDVVLADGHVVAWLYGAMARHKPLVLHEAAGSHFPSQEPHALAPGTAAALGDFLRSRRDRLAYRAFLLGRRVFRHGSWAEDVEKRTSVRASRELLERESGDGLRHRIATGLGLLEKEVLGDRLKPRSEVVFFGPVDPTTGATLDPGLAGWLEASDSPVILVSFGTEIRPDRNLGRRIRAGLQRTEARVLWVAAGTEAEPGTRQESSTFRTTGFVPQPEVLAHPCVRAFLTHGGSGSLQECLWAGKPALCVPLLSDQPYNGRVLEALGAGLVLPPRSADPGRVETAVARLLEGGGFAERSREIGGELRAQRGGPRVVEFLHSVAAGGLAGR